MDLSNISNDPQPGFNVIALFTSQCLKQCI